MSNIILIFTLHYPPQTVSINATHSVNNILAHCLSMQIQTTDHRLHRRNVRMSDVIQIQYIPLLLLAMPIESDILFSVVFTVNIDDALSRIPENNVIRSTTRRQLSTPLRIYRAYRVGLGRTIGFLDVMSSNSHVVAMVLKSVSFLDLAR